MTRTVLLLMSLILVSSYSSAQVPGVPNQATEPQADARADARRALARGIDLYRERRFSEAAESFSEATRLDAENGDAYFALATTLEVVGDRKKAIEAWRQAVALKPDHIESYIRLGKLVASFPGSEKGEAQRLALKALELDPRSVAAHLLAGLTYFQMDLDDKALEHWNEAIRLQPACAEAYANIGWLHSNARRSTEAITALEMAIRIDPNSANAYSTLLRVYLNEKDFAAAQRILPDLRRVNPADADWMEDSIELGLKEERIRASIKANPKNEAAHFDLGMLLFNAPWQYAEAATEFQAALKIRPRNVQARYYLAVCYVQDSKVDAARAELAVLRKHDPELAKKLEARIAKGSEGISFGSGGIEVPE